MLQVLQLLGNIALAVDQGLLADIGIRHLVLEGVGHLDVVSEYLVVSDLQGADAGFLLFGGLHGGDDALAAMEDAPQAVHLRVEALPDELPLPDGEGGIVAQGAADEVRQVLQGVQLGQLPQAAPVKGRQQLLYMGKPRHGVFQGYHVPAPGGAVYDAAHQALHVADARQGQGQLLPHHGVVHQLAHGAAAAGDGRYGQQGPLQPAAEHPPAHGGLGLVQHPEEAPLLLLAAQGLRQLQVPPGRQVQLHELPLLIIVQVVHMAQVGFLRLVEIAQQRPQRQSRGGVPLGQASGGLVAELGADGPFRLLQLKASGAQPLHMAVELILHQTQQRPAVVGRLVHHRLRRGKPPQLVEQVLRPVRTLEGGDVGLAGGDVAHAEARAGVVQIQPRAEVGASLLQAGRVNDRAGGHHPDDVPVHQALGRGGVLGLLADGHLVALGDEPGDIRVRGVIGDPAHGDLLLEALVLVLIPGGQGQVQLLGRLPGVVAEHLVKISQPEKQDGVLILFLNLQILLHHGGQLCHGFTRAFCRIGG